MTPLDPRAPAESAFQMVKEFHRAFGMPAPEKPGIVPFERLVLRRHLIEEEVQEYNLAVFHNDLEAVAREPEILDLHEAELDRAIAEDAAVRREMGGE